jgi:hypothetical protein
MRVGRMPGRRGSCRSSSFPKFAGTALWFSGNAVATQLQQPLRLTGPALGPVTLAVQAGFILGTVLFALPATYPPKTRPQRIAT